MRLMRLIEVNDDQKIIPLNKQCVKPKRLSKDLKVEKPIKKVTTIKKVQKLKWLYKRI